VVKINIVSREPFQFLEHGEPDIQISFMADDLRSGNRARTLPRWSKHLAKLEEAGYIEVVEGREEIEETEPVEPEKTAEVPGVHETAEPKSEPKKKVSAK